ncbi:hypothetical protein ADUPG1_005998, partial [Aduncisulcus paluster]
MSSLLSLDDSNPILSSLPFSQCPYCAAVVVDSSVGTNLGQVSFTDVSMCHEHCFMPSYSMSMSSFSFGVQVGPLSGSTSNTLPWYSRPSLCSSCCSIDHAGVLSREEPSDMMFLPFLPSLSSGSFSTPDILSFPIHGVCPLSVVDIFVHDSVDTSSPSMPISENHSALLLHPLGLLFLVALSITLVVGGGLALGIVIVIAVTIHIPVHVSISDGSRTRLISTVLMFLGLFTSSFHSALGEGLSNECSMYLSEDDHLVCNEVYPDRYAAECEEGYYYNEATYSCVIEDTTYQCPTISDEYHMCILADGDSSLSLGCRSAWYGDDCDQLYKIHIPDQIARKQICYAASLGYGLCDISEFEMAGISGYISFGSAAHFSSFEGAQYLININYIFARNNDVTSIAPLKNLTQFTILKLYLTVVDDYNLSISDFNSFYQLSRLGTLQLEPNEKIFDISILFKNIGITSMHLALNTQYRYIRLCRSEEESEFQSFLSAIFPTINTSGFLLYVASNACPINVTSEFYCDSNDITCPSIVLNEVYNSVIDTPVKECAFIAKTSGSASEGDLTCYTIHDDNIRAYLSDPTKGCLGSSDIEINGVISVATMRSVLSCPSSSLSLSSIATDMSLSSVNSITTLQGLEYATSLTSLNIDGYDLSDVNDSSEYDRLVIQILAKAVTSGTIDSGLTSLSASGCNLSAVSDVLDLTPIADGDSATQPFKLTSLDLSNNSISDVSVLITSDLFLADTLTTLDISSNSICNIDNVVSALQTKFTNLSSVIYSDQSCHCSASVSSTDHQVCREVYSNRWAVECWNGYYLDKASGECVAACSSGTVLDTSTTPDSCVSTTSAVDDAIRVQVCERHSNMISVLESGDASITCGCAYGYHGDSCEYVDIPDSNLRSALCLSVVNPSAHDSSCDDLTIADMATVTSVSASIVDSFDGLQYAVDLTSLSISGTSSSSVSIGNTDLGYLPLSLVELSLEDVNIEADSDFSIFIELTTLSLKNNSSYDVTNSALFPSSSSFISLDVSFTALSSFSSISTSITTMTANNCSSLTSFSTISNLTNLVSLDVSDASNMPTSSSVSAFASLSLLTSLNLSSTGISDPSPLYALSSSGSWNSLDLSDNHICGGDSAIETFLANKFSPATVNVSGQACICSSGDPESIPLTANKVCSETKPGSNSWYVVCASDSYTSYTDASTFSCISPANVDGTYGCSGGCEYGYECRYDSDSTSTLCQQVIV